MESKKEYFNKVIERIFNIVSNNNSSVPDLILNIKSLIKKENSLLMIEVVEELQNDCLSLVVENNLSNPNFLDIVLYKFDVSENISNPHGDETSSYITSWDGSFGVWENYPLYREEINLKYLLRESKLKKIISKSKSKTKT